MTLIFHSCLRPLLYMLCKVPAWMLKSPFTSPCIYTCIHQSARLDIVNQTEALTPISFILFVHYCRLFWGKECSCLSMAGSHCGTAAIKIFKKHADKRDGLCCSLQMSRKDLNVDSLHHAKLNGNTCFRPRPHVLPNTAVVNVSVCCQDCTNIYLPWMQIEERFTQEVGEV